MASVLGYSLRDRIRRGVYEPASSCKIFLPKPSGLLRPITLLTVEDQVVYQALVNVGGEKKQFFGKDGLIFLTGKEGATVAVKCDKDVNVLKVTVNLKK